MVSEQRWKCQQEQFRNACLWCRQEACGPETGPCLCSFTRHLNFIRMSAPAAHRKEFPVWSSHKYLSVWFHSHLALCWSPEVDPRLISSLGFWSFACPGLVLRMRGRGILPYLQYRQLSNFELPPLYTKAIWGPKCEADEVWNLHDFIWYC